jgi:hypothetical protein
MNDNGEHSIAELAAIAEAVSEQYHSQRRHYSPRRELERIRRHLVQATSFLESLLPAYDPGLGNPLSLHTDASRLSYGLPILPLPFESANDHLPLDTTAMDTSGWRSLPPEFTYTVPWGGHSFGTAQQQPSTTRPDTKKPVLALVSKLPKTPYKEQDASEAVPRTLAYVKVQRALLKHLDNYPSDTLSPSQARKWTQTIDATGNKEPKAVEALSLCYYMRAQGFDVQADVSGKAISLYCRTTTMQGDDADKLYWKQNFSTNRVEYFMPSASRAAPRVIPRPIARPIAPSGDDAMDFLVDLRRTSGVDSPPPEEVLQRQDPRNNLARVQMERGEFEAILDIELARDTPNTA